MNHTLYYKTKIPKKPYNTTQKKTSRNIYEAHFVLVNYSWSSIGLWSMIYIPVTLYQSKVFFPFPQVSLACFFVYILLYILYILFAQGWDFRSMLLFMGLGFYLAWICSCLRQAIKFSMSTYIHLSCCFVKTLFSWSYYSYLDLIIFFSSSSEQTLVP